MRPSVLGQRSADYVKKKPVYVQGALSSMRRTRYVGATVGCSREYFRMICRAHTCRGDSRFTVIKQVVALTKPLKETRRRLGARRGVGRSACSGGPANGDAEMR